MTKTFRNYLVLSFVLAVSLPAFAATSSTGGREPSPKITVRVYGYAQVPRGTLARAEKLAAEIFRKAGVETVWLDCRPLGGQPPAACKQPRGRSELVLRIIFQPLTAREAYGKGAIGYALRSEDGSGGDLATVFYDRVEEEVVLGGFDPFVILAHVAAHEIGHLLLPRAGHSPTGLMRAQLTRKDWRRASKGELLFTPEQAEQLQAGVLARIREEEATQLALLASAQ